MFRQKQTPTKPIIMPMNGPDKLALATHPIATPTRAEGIKV
ncbi:hypothetical protein SAMCFNEI73_pC1523 (plasmid) [Sinorhizobium americanum]|uniref:Uncharacterized protein n=1 Tax=Sinorhizobium americanum TaxID=194963 RepID=A0A1L3LYP5_9HYPH|nr:hypothetical protein SAMCFNEI73_pC1523 [Sinorhizobium americanum]